MANSPLGHDNRSNIVDMLRPPSGFRIGSAIGTTYSLDFMTLTSVMLAFLDSELEENEKYNVPQQLFALTRLAKKLCLFVNRSSILFSGVRQSSRIFAIYDRMIREINFPNGSFHPKVWFLRYDPKGTPENHGKESLYRLVVSSRNVTATNSWELGFNVSSTTSTGENKFGASLAQYYRQINDHLPEKHHLLNEALATLPSIQFALPESASDCSFDFQWPGRKKMAETLPESGRRATVISPFLGKTFLKELSNRFDSVTLVSKRRELDETLDQELVTSLQPNLFFVSEEMTADVSTRMSLHAKLYLFESDGKNELSLGSANASRNAWHGNNCEANIRLNSNLTQTQLLDQFVFKDRNKDELNPWIERYTIEDWKNKESESDEEAIDGQLQRIQTLLSSFTFELNYRRDASTLSLIALSQKQHQLIQDSIANGFTISAIPLSKIESSTEPDWKKHSIEQAFIKPYLNFDISIAELTEFMCFRVEHAAGNSKMFILKSSKHNFGDLYDTRDKQLMRAELSAKQFAQFLAAVLFDTKPDTGSTLSHIMSGRQNRQQSGRQNSVFIEEVLRSCTEDESRIEEVSKIVETFDGEDSEGNRYMSEDFCKFWNEFKIAFEKSGV